MVRLVCLVRLVRFFMLPQFCHCTFQYRPDLNPLLIVQSNEANCQIYMNGPLFLFHPALVNERNHGFVSVSVNRNPLTETREKQRKLVFQRMDKMRGFISPTQYWKPTIGRFSLKNKTFSAFSGHSLLRSGVRMFEKLAFSGFDQWVSVWFRFRETNWSKVSVSTETKKVVFLVHYFSQR